MKLLLSTVAAALLPLAAFAHDGLHVEDAYARSSNPVTGAVFMTIVNHREVPCQLTGAASDAAERVELHTHREEGGVMKMMKAEEGFAIPALGRHALARGGDHVMLLGLRERLTDGAAVALTLDFGDCGSLEVLAPVDNRRMPAADGDLGGKSN
ncbi:copper chaperone PCu(A)C [Paracoccus spongiarum]|uniref:Copper chaperone PCu(A)C n=1 Tax=Paracoccus spongiarum TaxID=3064387 RepID=A0ABT9JCD0_9RHOB|nr:copper chaperone PCu(A)C [Paracoccus sp. 2205BS29-5]MDP5307494.1 copper chaperone PCu(A)C [Paracoccus sp. 2205BS29-5]